MSASMQQIPAVPPRPSKSSEKDSSSSASVPLIPPRPLHKRIDRSKSPAAERFAQSPLNGGFASSATSGGLLSPGREIENPLERVGSVPMPSVGEEGMEYSAVTEEIDREKSHSMASSPEQTRTVSEDLELHAPKPSLSAHSAKQRVATVTRTDSNKAASFGIGRPSEGDDGAPYPDNIRKKASTSFSATSDTLHTDDEHGIPEIGQRVPMNPHLGDVQAPSPKPDSSLRYHHRNGSARNLPADSYGLHGHGMNPQDALEKAYYEKHPEALEREQQSHGSHEHRQTDYALSSADLNRLVRDTASRGSGLGTTPEIRGTPTDEVAFQASEEYASRLGSTTSAPPNNAHELSSLDKTTSYGSNDDPIHVDDAKHPEFRSYGDENNEEDEDDGYAAPILAPDEVSKDAGQYVQQPAIHLHRVGHDESENQTSRPISRPSSVHFTPNPEIRHIPLEDVTEYEPLFEEEANEGKETVPETDEKNHRHNFPSKDVWEDAPTSVHHTTEVSAPDNSEYQRKREPQHEDRSFTPAQAFAKHQEELAEKEARGRSTGPDFLPLSSSDKLAWPAEQAQVNTTRTASGPRFPSRDVWEDTPESLLQETTVALSTEKEEDAKPEIPARPTNKASDHTDKPAIPSRPKPKNLGDEPTKARSPASEKSKPDIPARPGKSQQGPKEGEAKQKPPVPSRPLGKIAALQAGFMNDLNKRLQLGPKALNKEESEPEQEAPAEKDKVPLSDARKGRVRGPQRRAPTKGSSLTMGTKASAPELTCSIPQSIFSIGDDGLLTVSGSHQFSDHPGGYPDFKAVEVVDKADPEKVAKVAAVPYTEALSEPVAQEEVKSQEQPAVELSSAETGDGEASEDPEGEPKHEHREESILQGKTLASNMAGESVLEASLEKKDGDDITLKELDDGVKS